MHATMFEEQFSLCLTLKENALLSVPASELVDAEKMTHFIAIYQPLIEGLNPKVAATFFCYSLAIASAGIQYLLSVENTSFDTSLDNLTVQIVPQADHYRILFVIHNSMEHEGPEDTIARAQWRKRIYTTYFSQTARPLVRILSTITGVSCGQLWGQFPNIFQYCHDMCMADGKFTSCQQRLVTDYHFLQNELEAEVFERKKNPFQVKARLVQDLYDPTKLARIKSSCCLYYQTGKGQYCYTCPRISEEERTKMRQEFALAKA